jgi:hypothetical protein
LEPKTCHALSQVRGTLDEISLTLFFGFVIL